MFFEQPRAYAIDVLVVLDDSPSMAGKQSTVQALAATLAHVTDQLPGYNDLRFLVVTSSSVPGCSQPVVVPDCASDRVVRWGQVCERAPNFTGALGGVIACAFAVGAQGCAVEQPLAAMEAALEHKVEPSFPRANAGLFVFIVSDEDDCSTPTGSLPFEAAAGSDDPALSVRCREADERGQLVPVEDYVRLLAMWPRLGGVSVVVSLPAPRLERLARGPGGAIISLSAEDLMPAFGQYGQRLPIRVGSPCLPAEIVDREPDRPGLQPECVVTEQVPDEAGRAVDRPLPRCEISGPPCWRVEPQLACPSGASWTLDHGSCIPPAPATVRASCLTGPGQ
jgi:hypothetical protein